MGDQLSSTHGMTSVEDDVFLNARAPKKLSFPSFCNSGKNFISNFVKFVGNACWHGCRVVLYHLHLAMTARGDVHVHNRSFISSHCSGFGWPLCPTLTSWTMRPGHGHIAL